MTQAQNLGLTATNITTGGVVETAAGGTGLATAGTAGNLLVSNGLAWVSQAGGLNSLSGCIVMWPDPTPPAGFLLCNGQAVSRTTYATLFALFDITFGNGDGSTTFNLPNYINAFPVGAGQAYAIGQTGGSADAVVVSHSHTASSNVNDPTHNHGVNDPGHSHAIQGSINTLGYAGTVGTWVNIASSQTGMSNTGISTVNTNTGITVGTTIDAAGTGGTGANLPPYLGIYFIIKT